ncbi:amidase [uncultured Williamsia sp.]|uniref:amidase n=1 Tax=uncultured Williamsia sp. TaxID=259311 RepID=UPI00262EDC95|nr:amidase [uncultured Williamsia sp.]
MDALPDIVGTAERLRRGEVTSAQLTEEAIARTDRIDPEVGSFVSRFDDQARDAAARADAELRAGHIRGPLHGIPVGVKDIITTTEGPTTAQSLVHDAAWNPEDAVVVSRLREAGAVIVGKLTTMEFAIGAPDEEKPFPIPRNPWDLSRWAGGSSSGSGSAVSTGMVFAALGTDTAGSIRIPAAYCGITGLMPTFGRVPKSGCVPLGFTLDHIGPMARSAADCAAVLDVIAGHHPSDLTSIDTDHTPVVGGLSGDLRGKRVGVASLVDEAGDAADPMTQRLFADAVTLLEDAGATAVPVQLPLYAEMRAANMVIMLSEALAYHLGDLRAHWSDYFTETRALVAAGLAFTGADYVQAQRVRQVAQQQMAELYTDVDLVVTPTCATGASPLTRAVDVVEGDDFATIHTQYWDCIGNPAMSLPMGFSADGLPLGLQVAGRPFDEAGVLAAGVAVQERSDWHRAVPPVADIAVTDAA